MWTLYKNVYMIRKLCIDIGDHRIEILFQFLHITRVFDNVCHFYHSDKFCSHRISSLLNACIVLWNCTQVGISEWSLSFHVKWFDIFFNAAGFHLEISVAYKMHFLQHFSQIEMICRQFWRQISQISDSF